MIPKELDPKQQNILNDYFSRRRKKEEGIPIEWSTEELQNRLIKLRKKSKYSLDVLSPDELTEIDYLQKALRRKGITYIGEPPPLRKFGP